MTPALVFFEGGHDGRNVTTTAAGAAGPAAVAFGARSLFTRLEACADARALASATALRIARAAMLLLRHEQARAVLLRAWNWSPLFALLQVCMLLSWLSCARIISFPLNACQCLASTSVLRVVWFDCAMLASCGARSVARGTRLC